jgi:two-component system osmolarity sensor histidine kinase EnvZ
VEIQVEAEKGLIFRIRTDEDRAYAANTGVLLLIMLLSSLVLLFIAVVFLRKQITPIVELANAAKSFGMGREVSEFRPRGAAEVRDAGLAFVDMKSRIARHVEQRTAMLAGVSHDLRTILTRFKLELAFLGAGRKSPLRRGGMRKLYGLCAAMARRRKRSTGANVVSVASRWARQSRGARRRMWTSISNAFGACFQTFWARGALYIMWR